MLLWFYAGTIWQSIRTKAGKDYPPMYEYWSLEDANRLEQNANKRYKRQLESMLQYERDWRAAKRRMDLRDTNRVQR